MRMAQIRKLKTPGYRVQAPSVAMFYVTVPCCGHCQHGFQYRRRIYCALIIRSAYNNGHRRSECTVPWNAICDKYDKLKKNERSKDHGQA